MKKEPIGLTIFRFALSLGLFVFMCLLYWSSTLIEEKMQEVKSDIAGIKNDLMFLSEEIQETKNLLGGVVHTDDREKGAESSLPNSSKRSYMDPSLPNLLSKDPFYQVTLPEILGEDFFPTGVFRDASVGKPDNLHPFNNWSNVNQWRGMCTVSVARGQFGKYETFAPNMAIKVEERRQKDSAVPEFWIHLREDVFWQPLSERMFDGDIKLAPNFQQRQQVTAHDFKFFYDAVMNPFVQEPGAVALRNYIGDIEEIEVLDDTTFIVRWRSHDVVDDQGKVIPKIRYIAKLWTGALSPLPGFVFKYFPDGTKIIEDDSDPETYRTNSVWAQNFKEHWAKNVIVSCGAWKFQKMTEREIQFLRNPGHYFPLEALATASVFSFKNTPDAIWQEFKSNRIDTYSVRPDQLIEVENFLQSDLYQQQVKIGRAIKRVDYLTRSYLYLGWNMDRPYFKSKMVRQALTMAIDRKRIIQQLLNGMGEEITGPFSPQSPAYDQTIEPWPFDQEMSKRLLEDEGWYDSDGDGMIDKEIDGKRVPFLFRLTYYVKNPTTKAIVEYVATALKELGIKCILNGVDTADLSATFDDKAFDAICLGWGLGTPPEDPRQLWHSEGADQPGSSNAVGFVNKEADAIIDQLAFESDSEKRLGLYHRFHRIIHDEQPYTFLYSPKTVLLYREYIKNVFIPSERQDLVPGANVAEPQSSVFYIKKTKGP